MNVIVLAAGTSSERDISIISGTGVAKALEKCGHNVYLLDAFFGCSDDEAEKAFTTAQDFDNAAAVMKDNTGKVSAAKKNRRGFFGPNVLKLCMKADKVFMALHGSNGEDGKVQAVFDLFDIPYSGCGYLGSAIAMDKGYTKILFNYFGVSTPEGFVINKNEKDHSLERRGLTLPVVVKPLCGGSSLGVAIVRKPDEYEAALQAAFELEDKAVVEKYIRGREFSVGVIGDEVYPVVEIIVDDGFYDYENKYNGRTREVCPAELGPEKTREMQELSKKAAAALGITGYSRMDILMDEAGRMYCLEANTLPGMTPTSLVPQEALALGMSYEELCDTLLRQEK